MRPGQPSTVPSHRMACASILPSSFVCGTCVSVGLAHGRGIDRQLSIATGSNKKAKGGETGTAGATTGPGSRKAQKSSDSSKKKRRPGHETMGKPVLRADESRPISNRRLTGQLMELRREHLAPAAISRSFSSLQIGNGRGFPEQTGGHLGNTTKTYNLLVVEESKSVQYASADNVTRR